MNSEKIYDTPIGDLFFSVFDVETTGLNASYNNIIEIGIVKVAGFQIIDRYSSLINPMRDIPQFITSFTGISNDDVYNAPFFEDIAGDIYKFIDDTILTAHNLSFDLSFLKKEFSVCGYEANNFQRLCTLRLARRMYPMLKSKSLAAITRHLKLKNIDAHRALSDAEVTARILIRMLKELENTHNIQVAAELLNYQYSVSVPKMGIKINDKVGNTIANLPDLPGVYFFYNKKNEIIYIGKAKSLRTRIKSYLSPNAPKKSKKIIEQAAALNYEVCYSELTALLSESELIKQIDPKHNRMLKSYGNKYFIRINRNNNFPRPEVCSEFHFDGNDYFGPFTKRAYAVEMLDIIERSFLLRECKDKELKKGRICFLAEIERCLAPCINIEKEKYENELNKVYEFLYGKNQTAVHRLINKMKLLSDKQRYEEASEIRDLINIVLAQTHKTSILAEPVNLANILIEVIEKNEKDYLLLRESRVTLKPNRKKGGDKFEQVLDDYYEGIVEYDKLPTAEDLEKMKIILSWVIKNRNKVNIYYLKNYLSKHELYLDMKK